MIRGSPSLLLSAATSWRLGVVVVASGVSEILCVVARLRPSSVQHCWWQLILSPPPGDWVSWWWCLGVRVSEPRLGASLCFYRLTSPGDWVSWWCLLWSTWINFAICGAPCSRAALAAMRKATCACEYYSWFSCLPVVVFAAYGSQYSVNMAIARMVVRNFTRCAFRVVLGANRKRCYGLTLHIAFTCWLLSDEASRTRDKLL